MTVTQEHTRFTPEAPLAPEVRQVLAPLETVVDLDQYAKALAEAGEAADPTDRSVHLSDYALAGGFFAESGGSVRHTPLDAAPHMATGMRGFVKRDHLQPIGAYKLRGGQLRVNRILQEQPQVTRFVTGSAGNAALAMALAVADKNRAAVERGELLLDEHGVAVKGTLLEAHVFGKRDMSPVKKRQLKLMEGYGVRLHNDFDDLDEAIATAEEMALSDFGERPQDATDAYVHKTSFVAPFNHEDVMAGQGTLLLETFADLVAQGVDLRQDKLRILVPVGGGGLYAGTLGVLEWAKHKGLVADDAEAIGVQLEHCDAAARDFYGEQPLTAGELNKKCDGTAVLRYGDKTAPLIKRYGWGFLRLNETELAEGMDYVRKAYHDNAEPAGALAPAAMVQLAKALSERTGSSRPEVVVSFLTGQNATPELRSYFLRKIPNPEYEAFKAMSAALLARETPAEAPAAVRPVRSAAAGALACRGVASGYYSFKHL